MTVGKNPIAGFNSHTVYRLREKSIPLQTKLPAGLCFHKIVSQRETPA